MTKNFRIPAPLSCDFEYSAMNEVRKLKKNVVICNFFPSGFPPLQNKRARISKNFFLFFFTNYPIFINLCLDLDNNLIVV